MKLGNKVTKILAVDGDAYLLSLKFSDGVVGAVDLKHIFSRPKALAAEIVKGQLFSKCYLESGAVAWPNGFELCPDALRLITKKTKGKAA